MTPRSKVSDPPTGHASPALDEKTISRLMPAVYDDLRRLARRYLRQEWRGRTIQPTDLVHEAYLRLIKDERRPWQNETHLLALAAISMRRILVERARARGAAKRGGSRLRVTLDERAAAADAPSIDVLALDQALDKLATLDPQRARIVELRFFGGLTVEEAAEALGISPATVKRGWSLAKAWLTREIRKEPPRGA